MSLWVGLVNTQLWKFWQEMLDARFGRKKCGRRYPSFHLTHNFRNLMDLPENWWKSNIYRAVVFSFAEALLVKAISRANNQEFLSLRPGNLSHWPCSVWLWNCFTKRCFSGYCNADICTVISLQLFSTKKLRDYFGEVPMGVTHLFIFWNAVYHHHGVSPISAFPPLPLFNSDLELLRSLM